MWLFNRLKKTVNTEQPHKQNSVIRNSFGEDMQHLTPDGDLPWGWVTTNSDFLKPINENFGYFLNLWLECKNKSPAELMQALTSFVAFMCSVKDVCSVKGECFDFWRKEILFEDKYLHERAAELTDIQNNMADYEEKYKLKVEKEAREKEMVPVLEEKLKAYIAENPGVLQSTISQAFSESEQEFLSLALYYLRKKDIVTREKAGRSFKLYIK